MGQQHGGCYYLDQPARLYYWQHRSKLASSWIDSFRERHERRKPITRWVFSGPFFSSSRWFQEPQGMIFCQGVVLTLETLLFIPSRALPAKALLTPRSPQSASAEYIHQRRTHLLSNGHCTKLLVLTMSFQRPRTILLRKNIFSYPCGSTRAQVVGRDKTEMVPAIAICEALDMVRKNLKNEKI